MEKIELNPLEQEHAALVADLTKPGDAILAGLTNDQVNAWHMTCGITGEAGEVSELIKKHVIYGKEFDRTKLVKELGDLEFYIQGLRSVYGISRQETLECNIAKLRERFGETYTDTAALARVDQKA